MFLDTFTIEVIPSRSSNSFWEACISLPRYKCGKISTGSFGFTIELGRVSKSLISASSLGLYVLFESLVLSFNPRGLEIVCDVECGLAK